jgi:hypothetical protein
MLSTFYRRSFVNQDQIDFGSVGAATSRVYIVSLHPRSRHLSIDKWVVYLFRCGISSHLLK